MNWIVSANENLFDHDEAFQTNGYIDWRECCKCSVGDLMYVYFTRPHQRIKYKGIVEKTHIPLDCATTGKEFWKDKCAYSKSLTGDFFRLRLLMCTESAQLSLNELIKNGLSNAPQRPMHVSNELAKYIDSHMEDCYSSEFYPDSNLPENSYEGACYSVKVDRYERSKIAREKCVEYHGCICAVCGFDFSKKYGDLGKGFIHVHHIVPLNVIGKEYRVDFYKDLIPVCPNCHAMLHRKIDGKYLSWEELRNYIGGKTND